jgi:hypothetical protein
MFETITRRVDNGRARREHLCASYQTKIAAMRIDRGDFAAPIDIPVGENPRGVYLGQGNGTFVRSLRLPGNW